MPQIKVSTLPVGDLQANCYIISFPGDSRAAVVDPGGDSERIIEFLKAQSLTPQYILLTHGHCDHIGAVNRLREEYPTVKLAAHAQEVELLSMPSRNLSWFFGNNIRVENPEVVLADGDELEIAGMKFTVIHVPGHSPGGVCYYHAGEEGEPVLFCGDVLFEESIGRTDFPGGSLEELLAGIRGKLLVLPENTVCYPGHGSSTTIGSEKVYNPFVK